jgi:hypothetical protein
MLSSLKFSLLFCVSYWWMISWSPIGPYHALLSFFTFFFFFPPSRICFWIDIEFSFLGTQAYNCLCDAFRIRRLGNRLIAVLCDGCALGRPAREAAQTAARVRLPPHLQKEPFSFSCSNRSQNFEFSTLPL